MNRNSQSESFSPGYCEYLVPGFAGRKIVLFRILALIVGAVLLSVLFVLLSFIPQAFAVFLVLIVAFEVIFFRMTSREFEYTVAMGEMTVEAIYGKKIRKKLLTVRLSEADRIFPVDGFDDPKIRNLEAVKTVFASPKKSEYMYCLCIGEKDNSGKKTALVFSSCKKLNDSIKFYNRSALDERK